MIDFNTGSPPPMRGKVMGGLTSGAADGITPAYAGKSIFIKQTSLLQKDHPRLCGEKL